MGEKTDPRKSVLLVDDDRDLLHTLKRMISKFGYLCRTSTDGIDALKKIDSRSFDVVIADIKMPKMGGIELLHRIKQDHPEIDVIMITGLTDEYTYTQVIKEGATDFISKPFYPDELEAKLHRIMREKKLKEELFYLSIRDSLTGLFNRRHFYETLKQEMERAKRQKRALSLILLDIDNFKEYNDKFGHLEGDKVLNQLAKILRSSLRQNVDSACRYGGDEFGCILIETDLKQAIKIGERIRGTYEKRNIGPTTLSVGICEYKPEFEVETFVKNTDDALYRAKREGGNRVVPFIEDQDLRGRRAQAHDRSF